ncbi:hypothetical protein PAPHI01_1870 [Pancytospora philotis]|nr:hypothetical protein PAPHI01_1870 [Pancytospora philotis]
MYEDLIAYLLGKKQEFTDDDLDEFIDLLNIALEITDEQELHRKQSIIENMVRHTQVTDRGEQAAITSAIDNILQFEEDDEDEMHLLDDKSESDSLLRSRKFVRGARGDRQSKAARALGEKKGGEAKQEETHADSASKQLGDASDRDRPQNKPPHLAEARTAKRSKLARAAPEEQEPVLDQDDLLKSVQSDACAPAQRDAQSRAQPDEQLTFSELFSTSHKTNTKCTKDTVRVGAKAQRETAGASGEFKFDVGDLESNHNDGPDVYFRTDESE